MHQAQRNLVVPRLRTSERVDVTRSKCKWQVKAPVVPQVSRWHRLVGWASRPLGASLNGQSPLFHSQTVVVFHAVTVGFPSPVDLRRSMESKSRGGRGHKETDAAALSSSERSSRSLVLGGPSARCFWWFLAQTLHWLKPIGGQLTLHVGYCS